MKKLEHDVRPFRNHQKSSEVAKVCCSEIVLNLLKIITFVLLVFFLQFSMTNDV